MVVFFQNAPAVYATTERLHEPAPRTGRHASARTIDGLLTGTVVVVLRRFFD